MFGLTAVQIASVERGDPRERIEIGNEQPAVGDLDPLAAAKLVQHPVDVHRRQADRFGDLGLRRRKVASASADATAPALALENFAQKMRHPLDGDALAEAQDPVAMARAMSLAVESGRLAYLAGRMPRRERAVPSSPARGMLG